MNIITKFKFETGVALVKGAREDTKIGELPDEIEKAIDTLITWEKNLRKG